MIDSALDRELETISEETAAEKRAKERKTKKVNISDLHTETPKNDDIFVRMDVAQAIDLVNSESSCGINTDLCREITQTLTDSLVTKKSKNSTMPMDNYVLVPGKLVHKILNLKKCHRSTVDIDISFFLNQLCMLHVVHQLYHT
ncbi:hypothetical protein C0J52_06345 [Blattella germanica]|nr:hypothetical protein C0J52_06345 [Blattella germanica]